MLEHCLQKLADKKIRLTPRRRLLLVLLHEARSPLAVPDILKLFAVREQSINKTTVYRELERLVAIGLVKETVVNERKQYYELSERGHHHHLVCTQCDRMYEIELSDTMLVRKAEELGKRLHFVLLEHVIDFYGLCLRCQPKKLRGEV